MVLAPRRLLDVRARPLRRGGRRLPLAHARRAGAADQPGGAPRPPPLRARARAHRRAPHRTAAGADAPARPQDYLFYNDIRGDRTGSRNNDFQKVIKFIKEDNRCRGSRLHWGKAGWPDDACDDTGSDYPRTWCHFGCAVRELDPRHKFAQESTAFKWDDDKLRRCCTRAGFDDSLPGCRHGCKADWPTREALVGSRQCRYPPAHPSKRYPALW